MKNITVGQGYEGLAVPGSFQASITENGKTQLGLDFMITDDDGNPLQVTSVMSWEGGAKPYTLERLKAAGWDGRSKPGPSTAFLSPVTLNTKEEEYEGTKSIKFEIRTGGAAFKFKNEMSAQQLDGFGADLLSYASALEQKGGYPDSFDNPTSKASAGGGGKSGGPINLDDD